MPSIFGMRRRIELYLYFKFQHHIRNELSPRISISHMYFKWIWSEWFSTRNENKIMKCQRRQCHHRRRCWCRCRWKRASAITAHFYFQEYLIRHKRIMQLSRCCCYSGYCSCSWCTAIKIMLRNDGGAQAHSTSHIDYCYFPIFPVFLCCRRHEGTHFLRCIFFSPQQSLTRSPPPHFSTRVIVSDGFEININICNNIQILRCYIHITYSASLYSTHSAHLRILFFIGSLLSSSLVYEISFKSYTERENVCGKFFDNIIENPFPNF